METSSPAETEKWLTENGTEDFERTEEDYHFKANGIVRLRYVLLPETLSPLTSPSRATLPPAV